MDIPAPYDDPPYIEDKFFGIFIWAFNTLSAEREPSEQIDRKNWKINRISNKAIREWAELYDYHTDHDFMYELLIYIRALDTVWVELELKRLKGASHGKPS